MEEFMQLMQIKRKEEVQEIKAGSPEAATTKDVV